MTWYNILWIYYLFNKIQLSLLIYLFHALHVNNPWFGSFVQLLIDPNHVQCNKCYSRMLIKYNAWNKDR